MPQKQKKFVPPTETEVAEYMLKKFRETFPIRDEPLVCRICALWARDFMLHYTKTGWRWGRKLERPMKEWHISATQWFNANVDDGKHIWDAKRLSGQADAPRSIRIVRSEDVGNIIPEKARY